MDSPFDIRSPETEEEFTKYYRLRFDALREPWGDVEGSEREADDAQSVHRMLVDKTSGEVLGVARLHFNSPTEAQVRLMAVRDSARGQGLGRLLMAEMERVANDAGAKIVVLHARDYAVGFYEKLGYDTIKASYLLMDVIQHYLMEKTLP